MGGLGKFDKAFKEQALLRILSGETTVNKMAEVRVNEPLRIVSY